MQLALGRYNDVAESTRSGLKYCDLASGTNALQCVVNILQPLHTAVVQVNVAMQALAEGVTSTGTCVSYLHETIKRGNAFANGYEKAVQAVSGSDHVNAAVLRLMPGLARQSKWWRQDIVAMATTCGTSKK
jgi:hypothetical protein